MQRHAFLLLVLCGANSIVIARTSPEARADSLISLAASAPKVFINCSFCDLDYIRTEITFVNYVRDRNEAQVDILITTQPTGGGGTEYTLTFIGQKEFAGMDDTLKYVSRPSEAQDEIRKGLVKVMKLGLIRYVARTPIAKEVSIGFTQSKAQAAVKDRWDYWVFSISENSFLSGEKSLSSSYLNGSASARRVTKDLKVFFSGYVNYSESDFTISGQTIKSVSRGKGLNELVAFGLGEHWSVGEIASAYSSTYGNTRLGTSLGPAVEYDIFPYSESTRRQLRILYNPSFVHNAYYEETIFGKYTDNLFKNDLTVTVNIKQPWGTVSTSIEGSHYFNDFNKNRLQVFGQVSLNLFEGMSINLFGSASMIHDQISLPIGGATPDEILLRQKELATQYSYFASIGLSYTFGSIYNNIVNPRFGDQSGGGFTIIY